MAPVAAATPSASRMLLKPEPVNDAGYDTGGAEAWRSAVAAVPLRAEKPCSPPTRRPVDAAPPQPETIDISSTESDDNEFRVRRVKKEPIAGSGRSRERPASGTRAVALSAAKKKRKRESPGGRDKFHTRRSHRAASWDSGASGAAGRRTTGQEDEARSSKERKHGKSREASRDRSRLAKEEALVSSEESRGVPGKARHGGRGMEIGDSRRSPAPVSLVGATVGSRVRSRSRQRGSVQYSTHSARVSSDDDTEEEDGEGEEVQQEQEKEERRGEVERMEAGYEDSGGDNGLAPDSSKTNGSDQEKEQGEEMEGENSKDVNSDDNEEVQTVAVTAAAVATDDEMLDGEGEKEMEEEQEGGDEEDSHSIYDGVEAEAEQDSSSEEDEDEFDETGEEQQYRNDMAAGSAMSGGDGKRIFGKRIFEGIILPEKVAKTMGMGIEGRTRSKRKCLDRKLLKRGTFSKPYNIDVSDVSSESEEEEPPPPPPQGLLSSSEDNSNDVKRKRRRKKNRRWNKKGSSSSDDYEEEIKFKRVVGEGSSRRLKKASKEGCKDYDGSNPDGVDHHGLKGGRPMNASNAQNDLEFKKSILFAQRKHGRASRAKAEYDELLNSLFAEWENHTDGSLPADGQNLPLLFSFGDEDKEEKSESDKLQEQLWQEFDLAFESLNIGSHGCDEDEISNEKNVPPWDAATSCKNGKHDFIIDEEIGVRCKHCNVVDLEIRYVMPSMGKFSTERESTTNPESDSLFKEMLTLFEENDLLVSNKNERAHDLSAHKAGSVWDLIPGVKENMFMHQKDAFEFMWKKLAGSTEIEELKRSMNTDIGGGCVISHAPGTGKTRLAITFVQSYLELFPQCHPVIIAPRAMLATWEHEFRKWKVKLPFHVLNSTDINWSGDKTIEEQIAKDGTFARRLWANKMDQNYRRLVKLASWLNGTSIIGVSYSLFRKLANDEGMDGEKVRKLLLEKPDLLVLDEGHTPRNKKSLIFKVLAEVHTEKRIILSGTPFQNNFEELYNTLCLVRPKDAMLLEKDESKDFWTKLRLSNITGANIAKIQKALDPVVHCHKGNFLEQELPGLKETVVILKPLARQKEIIASMEKTVAMGTLDSEYKISLASVHPYLITKLSTRESSLVDNTLLQSLRFDPNEGVKTRFVAEVVHLSQELKERVLVFSQYIEPLSLIMDQLKRRFKWSEDKEILQMSGTVPVKQREAMMEAFNNMKSEAKVMLASTKACCEGITLIGASRVVLIDVVWNPSVGRQAIGRAYRIGQKKVVYTYNLIADGTKEMEKYNRQATKEHMSKMLFSNEQQPGACNMSPESAFNDKILEKMTAREDLKDLFVEIRIENQSEGSILDAGEMEKKNTSLHFQ